MDVLKPLLTTLLLTLAPAISATTSISWRHYDQYANSSPYYTFFGVSSASSAGIGSFAMNDSGWGYRETGASSFHIQANNESTSTRLLRSIGWQQFQVYTDDTTATTNVSIDGNIILSGTTTLTPDKFYFNIADFREGSGHEAVIDDFEIRVNGAVVYRQGFDNPTLPAGWYVSHQTNGTYTAPGDPTTVRSGTGSMALGKTGYGELYVGVAFDLTSVLVSSVPEPSTTMITLCFFAATTSRRRRRNHP